jgi:Spy/CpxP family protein refolding chaperone
MALAKAAELNGYPGPAHVLELAGPLALTDEQRAGTEAIFQRMQARAIPLGRDLVDAERALDRMFASRAMDDAKLTEALARIGTLSAQVREVHLHAHLEQAALLTAEQVAKYNELRGYAADAPAGHGHGHGH